MSYITKTSSTELQETDESFFLEIPTTIKKALQIPVVKYALWTGAAVGGIYGLIYFIRLTTKVVGAVKGLTKEMNS
jgi:hypothetical protein